MNDKIIIKGARENNLKNIDLEIPRDKFVVFTGLSGSGKSSLAFDTIYSEGQRRYVESISAYARQFLDKVDKPDVEYIEGLSPAIAIDQKTTSNNPRSTVGTVTEIYDYLRLLFANVGTPHCPICGKEISKLTVQEIVGKILDYELGTKIQVIAPVIRGKKGSHQKILEGIKKDGYMRMKIDGEQHTVEEKIELEKTKKHDISVIIDRLVIKEGLEKRLTDSVETALKLGDGLVVIDIIGDKEITYSTKLACIYHDVAIPDLSAAMFSFNNPLGACPHCSGLGSVYKVEPSLVVPNEDKTLREGAIEAWDTSDSDKESGYYFKLLQAFAKKNKISMDIPYKDLPEDFKDKLMNGSEEILEFDFDSRFGGKRQHKSNFEGILPNLERRYRNSSSNLVKEKIEKYIVQMPCPSCHGARLNDLMLAVKVGGQNIYQVTQKSIEDLLDYMKNLTLTNKQQIISKEILKEIKNRATFLSNVGLDYLTLSRTAGTLSGGESQRIRLANQIGSALVGVLYVLDEPSIGLHQKDNDMLLKALRNLTDAGNTLIVVEHDEDTIKSADYVVDIGPGAGVYGGEIVAQGSVEDLKKSQRSITGDYLAGRKTIEVPKKRRKIENGFISIKKASENNLKDIDVDIPLGVFTCVTGVSGSGKSTLVNEILFKAASKKIYKSRTIPGKHEHILGLEKIDKVVDIDQSPIGRTPRSNPATYTGVFDSIRDVFATMPEAKERGYSKGRFSFNVKGGRCEACKGDGIIKIEMHFLPDVYVPCEVCNGTRFNSETLKVTYKGKNISDVLNMDVKTAVEFFDVHTKIKRRLQRLMDVGLSYIKLGQPSTELSGGEAQRVKLATELSKVSTGNTLYILDEPTTGLHMHDVKMLIKVLQELTDLGNTVVVIEHNLDVIKSCDYIIDLGPEGGVGGGEIVATGTPEDVAKSKKSYTGKYLKPLLKK
ncbi:excinuclease ABC subunit UvrA [Criibacterium bergeronii]|uniref:UvrABC system protein A n=1 Tax=Criibacterium bergeronii TaxID=1871336 RepID=A0A552V8T8_9FIRM|nr:excinuclease ABC subunit UvrA [Criibacterium bergeronii]TRW26878.1 excinuclease ABC subunit UvrA [Criibacterium bergeronii]